MDWTKDYRNFVYLSTPSQKMSESLVESEICSQKKLKQRRSFFMTFCHKGIDHTNSHRPVWNMRKRQA